MNKTLAEATDFINGLLRTFPEPMDRDIIIAPAFTALYAMCCAAKGTAVRIAAQNVFWREEGAYTGEVSAAMLKEVGCDYVIIGHSERRQLFAETDQDVNRKILSALAAGLKAIVCIGETLEERESGQTFIIIEHQLKEGLNKINSDDIQHIVFAYEPVWAIGTGKTAKPEQAQEVHNFIRRQIGSMIGSTAASEVVILYGGSVNSENISSIMAEPDINGALVGGASLDLESFIRIVNYDRI